MNRRVWQGLSSRKYPIGAEVFNGGIAFRIWAPRRDSACVVIGDVNHEMTREPDGHYAAFVYGATAGCNYHFHLDDDKTDYPDPASRFQPRGPHGPSRVVDPASYRWTDTQWRGAGIKGRVLYEMHVGTFTPQGTWRAAAERLAFLSDLGITTIEMMPVSEFSGTFGWGYDGVDLFAPTHLYGEPDDLRFFIDRAHTHGLGVILDVVYNHLGPDGNYLSCFSPDYFTERYRNDWGAALNFDGAAAKGMRDFVISNAAYWIDEFHFDGLRLDATQSICDDSPEHIVTALTKAVRVAAKGREIIVVAENEPQDVQLVQPLAAGGMGLDAVWNDDLHHSAMVALTGRKEAYYEDHFGAPQEFISAAKYGYLFQGQRYAYQRKGRGKPGLDLLAENFVTFIQNHDQIANSATGLRFHALTSPSRARAMTALLLLMPGTPMLFQGQEFWASTRFHYFADHEPSLAADIREGRREFMSQFCSMKSDRAKDNLPDPSALATVQASTLQWAEADSHSGIVAMHRDLLRLRRETRAIAAATRDAFDGSVIGPEALAMRYRDTAGEDCLLLVNFGIDLHRRSIPDPLVAPPRDRSWATLWSSENVIYGGSGVPRSAPTLAWYVPGHSALLLHAVPSADVSDTRPSASP